MTQKQKSTRAKAKPQSVEPSVGGKREANKRRVQRQILEAATKLIARHGYANVTLTQIAEASGIHKRTFFNHYKAKDDLVFSWAAEYREFVLERLEVRAAEMPADRNLEQAMLDFSRLVESERLRMSNVAEIYFSVPELRGRIFGEMLAFQQDVADRLQQLYRASPAEQGLYRIMLAGTAANFMLALREWTADEGTTLEARVCHALDVLRGGWHLHLQAFRGKR